MKLILLAALALAGCAHGPVYDYKKDGSTMADKKRDWINCRAKLGQAGYVEDGDRFMRLCMEGEGWEAYVFEK